jgi:hypothetical protein
MMPTSYEEVNTKIWITQHMVDQTHDLYCFTQGDPISEDQRFTLRLLLCEPGPFRQGSSCYDRSGAIKFDRETDVIEPKSLTGQTRCAIWTRLNQLFYSTVNC